VSVAARAASELELRSRWLASARVIVGARDLLHERPWDGEPTRALLDRGWAEGLLALSDPELRALELGGLAADWPPGTPTTLLELIGELREVCRVEPLLFSPTPPRPDRRLESPRKRAQVDALARALEGRAESAARIVDVGSGHGHLTRELAETFGRPVLGLERSSSLTARARSLPSFASPSFAVSDVLRDGIPLAAGDWAVALHACGELGDAVVREAAASGASVALVGCCLQKQRAAHRAPLCHDDDLEPSGGRGRLALDKRLLGLSNLTARERGVEASFDDNLASRRRRLALHRLLSSVEPGLPFGAEIAGLNRRAARSDLPGLVARAFALRGLAQPSAESLAEAARWADEGHARARRLSLPRAAFSRVLEVFVLLDRALYLRERSYAVELGELFPAEVSARNLALFATSP
jgi:SAM-dependent methyltransferase